MTASVFALPPEPPPPPPAQAAATVWYNWWRALHPHIHRDGMIHAGDMYRGDFAYDSREDAERAAKRMLADELTLHGLNVDSHVCALPDGATPEDT